MKIKRTQEKPKEIDWQPFTVRFPEDVLSELDAEAKREDRTRNALLLRIVKERYGLVDRQEASAA